jgi:hypothetical protein
MQIARKVVWYDAPEQTLVDLPTFLAHLIVYGSLADVATVEGYVPRDEFQRALENAPAGVFTRDAGAKWHNRLNLPVAATATSAVSGWFVRTRARRFLRPVG